MKKIGLILVVATLVLAGCSTENADYGKVTKVTDYLYEVSYNTLDYSVFDDTTTVKNEACCSSVRNGAFHGRNLDLYYNEACEAVVHVSAAEGRFASVAVCGAMPRCTDELLENGDSALMRVLPFIVIDGINENGVATNVNVVPAADHPIATGTKPGARRMNMAKCQRYILDNAKSAAHAVELLQELDLYGGFGDEFGLHLMISDPKETYIVEIIDNEIQYVKGERENDANIMTNLYSTQLPDLTPHAEGIERYELLKANYAEGNTEEGMVNLMRRAQYTQAYNPETNPFWYSEFYGVFNRADGSVWDVNVNTPREEVMESAKASIEACKKHERTGGFWQTVNTSVYNLDEKTLLLYVQEDYTKPYRFGL